MLSVVSEILPHGAARVGSQVLQRRSIGGSGRYHYGVLHSIGVCQPLHQLSHSGSLLANSNVDAIQLFLLISSVVETFLVDDGVNGDGSFAAKQTRKP